jgi:hypothetical protein
LLVTVVNFGIVIRTAITLASATKEFVTVTKAIVALHATKSLVLLRIVQAMGCVTKKRGRACAKLDGVGPSAKIGLARIAAVAMAHAT